LRIWTLHPSHLDPAGLVALWREALLAQAALCGRTRGYTRHPQLARFRAHPDPVAAMAAYLRFVHAEAESRGYSFNLSRVVEAPRLKVRIPETRGQLLFEWAHLAKKLRARNPAWHARHHRRIAPTPHPLFRIVAGGVRSWERVPAPPG